MILQKLKQAHAELRDARPLILCLTNYVTMDFMANSLLALGAAPLMTQSGEELAELLALGQAVNINIGTLDQAFCKCALLAAKLAKEQKKPVILDPVGAGASQLRTRTAKALLPYADVLRANASEILALAEKEEATKGVESTHSVQQALYAAKNLAASLQKSVVVSGPVDFLTDGRKEEFLPFGSALMPLVTGMGCTLAAVIAAFSACASNVYQASVLATAYFGLCGQAAQRKVEGPASFRQAFIDNLYKPDWVFFEELIEQV